MTRPHRLLLCTDMDRTVIPNGLQPEHPDARRRFRAFCDVSGIQLVYVTGRHRELVEEAIAEFALPVPDFVITDVGTRIYRSVRHEWEELLQWSQAIGEDWHGRTHGDLQALLQDIDALRLQEQSKQSAHKLSYYVSLANEPAPVLDVITGRLQQRDVDACVLWSIDEPNATGLLDVIPRHGTKLHAIEFLQQFLGFADDEVLFAGDSGNDMPVLVSRVRSVLVNNASDDIKQAALQSARENGTGASLYLAGPDCPLTMNGNYCAGVLQGVWHYAPHFRAQLAGTASARNSGNADSSFQNGTDA